MGQHSVCINLSSNELDIIPKLLIYGDFIINSINGKNIRDITNKLSSLSAFSEINKRVGTLIDITEFTAAQITSLEAIKKTFDKFDEEVFDTLLIYNYYYSKSITYHYGTNWGRKTIFFFIKIIYIVIILILLFFNGNSFVVSLAPKCKTTKNVYQGEASSKYSGGKNNIIDVEWWFLQQLSDIDGGAIYTDSSLSGKETISEINNYYTKNDNGIPNPVTVTYEQILDHNNNYYSIVYNNEPPNKINNDPTTGNDHIGAHAKGFFIWNMEGGIHVIHSYPKSPVKGTAGEFFVKRMIKKNMGQHSVCINLSPNELDIIPKLLIYGDFDINAINGVFIRDITNKLSSVSNFKGIQTRINGVGQFIDITAFTEAQNTSLAAMEKKFASFDEEIFDKLIFDPKTKHWSKDKIELSKWSTVASLISNFDFSSYDFTAAEKKNGVKDCIHYNKVMDQSNGDGQYFVQTTNTHIHDKKDKDQSYPLTKRGFNMIWDYIADYYSTNHRKTGKWFINTMQKGGISGNDKMAMPSNLMNLVIRTDAPWSVSKSTTDGSQHSKLSYLVDRRGNLFCKYFKESRGGSAFCSKNLDYLAEYYERRVTFIADPPVNNDYDRFGGEVLPFSSFGFQIDFSKITNDLQTNGIDITKRIPLMEFKLKDQKNAYKSFNPRIFIDTETKPSIIYDKTGGFTYDSKKLIKGFNSEIKEIYVPLKLVYVSNNQEPSKFTYETAESFSLFISPSIKNEIILCDEKNIKCDYDYMEQLFVYDLKITFEMGNFKILTNNKIGHLKQDKIALILKSEKKIDFKILNNEDTSRTINQIILVNDIKSIFKYFEIERETPIRFIKSDKLIKKNDQIELIEDSKKCKADDNSVFYDENCYDFLVFCLSDNYASKNKGAYNKNIDDFDKLTNPIMDAISWTETPKRCLIQNNNEETDKKSQSQKPNPKKTLKNVIAIN
ncbi:hypothetical protein DICPUDRAFT_157624 [Dictyostelium purpureum]|uniref:Uncharacterized protein n=1 Tax=Dictyostelium purpureum TaxID=5786 RepID=F0ZZK4_DICPU|nr:uncharacterized protein DICPUDRAFT_157624 [Dictyostelium purpureum]EGC30627.1 hypothetical protein DICPUDRAFT_157624 [Dictyostelium purpureum]|eukprot:XP_003292862.1 hypothetical protein DICPUDRAFT_157624 [Dictyostelium purpureum]